VQLTQLTPSRTLVSSPKYECTSCRQHGHASSKSLLQKNPPVLSWRCQLMQVVLYGRKMVVVVVLTSGCSTCSVQSWVSSVPSPPLWVYIPASFRSQSIFGGGNVYRSDGSSDPFCMIDHRDTWNAPVAHIHSHCLHILSYKRILRRSNVILRTLFRFKQSDICALLAKYRIPLLSLPVHVQKNYICVSKATDAGHLMF